MRLTLLNQFYAPDISPTAQLAASLAEHRAELGDRVTIVTGRAGYLEGLAPAVGVRSGPGLRIRRVWTPDLGKSSRARRLLGYATFSLGSVWQVLRLSTNIPFHQVQQQQMGHLGARNTVQHHFRVLDLPPSLDH